MENKTPDSPAKPVETAKAPAADGPKPAPVAAVVAKNDTPAKPEVKVDAAKPEATAAKVEAKPAAQPAKAEAKPEAAQQPAKVEPKVAPPKPAVTAAKVEAKPAAVQPAKAEPKAAAVKPAAPAAIASAPAPVKRGRGRPRKSEAEKAATRALRKQKTAAQRRAAVVQPIKPAAIRTVKPITERKPIMTIDTNNFFAGLGTVPGTDQIQAAFADANVKSREALSKSAKVAEELVELTKANVEAVVSSGRIASAGVQALSQDALAYGKEGVEKASAAVKSFAEAKSPTELFRLQSEFARASFDRVLSNSSKLTESLVKLVGETVEPLSSRASVNAGKINSLIA